MRSIKSLSCGFAALLVALLAAPASAQSMDGYWVIQLTPDGASVTKGAMAFEERMLIEGGSVTAEIFSKYGFTPKTASVISSSPLLVFEAIMTADKFGSLKWRVTVKNANQTTGTLTWTRHDGVVWVFNFEADKGTPPPTAAD